jgi:hypothetical protein
MSKLTIIVCLLAATAPSGGPANDAAKVYRDYVAAIRSGPAEKVLKLVEPVPESSKVLLAKYVETRIAIERFKAEIAKQFNPPKPDRGDTIMGEFPNEWLKDVVAEPVDARTMQLKLKDPDDPQIESPIGLMIRRGDAWLVSATLPLDEEASATYVEPRAEIRDAKLKVAEAWSAAAKSTLDRLQKKEFKSAAEAEGALKREFARAAGM